MPNGKNQPDEISIEWEYDKNYRMVPANGMWGGITPRGDLRIDFFVESMPVPDSGAGKLLNDGSGRYTERQEASEKVTVVRQIQVGVMVPSQQVQSFMRWFQDKAQKVKASKEIQPEGKVN